MRLIILLFASFSVFIGMCHGAPTSSSLTKSAVLDDDGNYELYWKFDDTTITFEVQVNTLGWIGFGISTNGDMIGSDIVIGWVDSAGTGHMKDRYATGRLLPPIDDHQDWILMKSSQTDTKTIMQFKRNLKPCDDRDVEISEATARVIWAYNTDDPTSETDILQHTARGTKSVLLLTEPLDPPTIPSDTFEWKMTMDNIDKFIHPGNEKYVHHMVLYGCANPMSDDDLVGSEECFGFGPRLQCSADIYAWVVGGGPFVLPEKVGFPFGETDSPQAIVLEVHYNNPNLEEIVDSSGVVVTLTPILRQHDAAVIETGIVINGRVAAPPGKPSMLIPPGSPAFVYHGHCTSNCLSEAMAKRNKTELNVFAGMLHAHLAARKLKFRHFRDGVELPPIFKDDHYDFNYQEYRLRKEMIIQSGDNLITECTFDTTGRTDNLWGGWHTYQEMCLTFMLYYPKIPLTNCGTTPVPSVYMPTLGLTYDDAAWRNDLDNVTWTDELKEILQSVVIDPAKTVYTRCEQQGTFTSSDHFSEVTPDAITNEYTAPYVACKEEVEVTTTDGSEKAASVMSLIFVSALVAVTL